MIEMSLLRIFVCLLLASNMKSEHAKKRDISQNQPYSSDISLLHSQVPPKEASYVLLKSFSSIIQEKIYSSLKLHSPLSSKEIVHRVEYEENLQKDQPMDEEGLTELEAMIQNVSPANESPTSAEKILQPRDTDYDGPPVVEIIPDPIIRTLPPEPTPMVTTDDDFLRELEAQIITDDEPPTEHPQEPVLIPKETDYDGPPVDEVIPDPVTTYPLGN